MHLHSFLATHGLNLSDIQHIIQQGMDVEKLNIEVEKALSPTCKNYESECRILQAQVLLSLLRVSSLGT